MASEQDVKDGMTALSGALDAFDQVDAKAVSDQKAATEANQAVAVSGAARDNARQRMRDLATSLDSTIADFFGQTDGGPTPPPPPPGARPTNVPTVHAPKK